MRKKDQKNLIKAGIFISALTIVLMILVISIGKENSLFSPKANIKARVNNVANLKVGSYVELKGIRIGSVTQINIIADDSVEITANILADVLKWIKKDSKVSISNAGLVGDKYLEIHDGSADSPSFDVNSDVLISESATNLKKILSKGESIAELTEKILSKLDMVMESLSMTGSVNSVAKTAQNMESISKELKEAKLGEMVKSVNSTMGSLDRIMRQIEKGPGTLNSLVYDDVLHEDLRAVLGGAQRNKVIKFFIRESIKNSEKKKDADD